LWREELQWLNYGSLYLDFKKILARVMYKVQIPRAQNIFMGSRVVYEIQIPRAQNIFMGPRVVYEAQIPRAQNIFTGLPLPTKSLLKGERRG
jgi:hypothetical protein